jgi:hypothetical protein
LTCWFDAEAAGVGPGLEADGVAMDPTEQAARRSPRPISTTPVRPEVLERPLIGRVTSPDARVVVDLDAGRD